MLDEDNLRSNTKPCLFITDKVTTDTIESLLELAAIPLSFNNTRILQTIAVCWTEGQLPMVVTPYMANGDLRSLIRRSDMVGITAFSTIYC